MVRHYLLDQAEKAFLRREAAFEELETPGQMREHQRRMREFLRTQLGGFPERTPLEARIVGRHQRDGYSVERVLYQSRPGHYVTALLYLPEGPPPLSRCPDRLWARAQRQVDGNVPAGRRPPGQRGNGGVVLRPHRTRGTPPDSRLPRTAPIRERNRAHVGGGEFHSPGPQRRHLPDLGRDPGHRLPGEPGGDRSGPDRTHGQLRRRDW